MPSRVELRVFLMTCARCGARTSPDALRGRDGTCGCGNEVFHVSVTAHTTCSPDMDDVAKVAVRQAAFGILNPLSLSAMGDTLSRYAEGERSYELMDVAGSDLIDWLALPPEEALREISARRKEQAKANLQPHQGLCQQCGEIYAKAIAGPAAHGFCSKLCEQVYAKEHAPPPAAKAPRVEAIKVTCPKCSRPVKIRPTPGGGPYKCVWCGGPIQP